MWAVCVALIRASLYAERVGQPCGRVAVLGDRCAYHDPELIAARRERTGPRAKGMKLSPPSDGPRRWEQR